MVSPGNWREDELIRELKRNGWKYWLPQYMNAFLLAKDIVLEFRGVSSKTVSQALSGSASGQIEGGYGPFSASASAGASRDESHLATEATADGLKIRIPGAQVIGYYLTVLPRFPNPKMK